MPISRAVAAPPDSTPPARLAASALTAVTLLLSVFAVAAGVQQAAATETGDDPPTVTIELSAPEAAGPDIALPDSAVPPPSTTVAEPAVRGTSEVNAVPEVLAMTGRTTYVLVAIGVLLLGLGGSTRIVADRLGRAT